jgi:phytoene dehydrogenase-like protein
LFDYLSGGRLQWNRMPEAFERFVYPGLDFAVPADPERYRDNLIEAFPEEARAIRRYFRDVHRAARWTMLGFMRAMVPRPVAPLIGIVQRLTAGAAVNSTADYLHRHFRSPRLRALLASQWGDYGLPPGRSAFAIHAMIVSHYLHGAWFPVGGSAHVARSFEAGIERAGGAIRVGQEVVDILVEEGRAVGVRVLDRRGPAPQECIHRAPVIISNVGARLTFEKLLPTTGTVGEATAAVRRFMDRLGEGASAVTLYLRLREDARTLGVRGENCWINCPYSLIGKAWRTLRKQRGLATMLIPLWDSAPWWQLVCPDTNHLSEFVVDWVALPRGDPSLFVAGTAPGRSVLPPDWPTMAVRVDFREARPSSVLLFFPAFLVIDSCV